MIEEARGLCGVSFKRAPFHSWGLCPHDLVTSPKPHAKMPSHWGLNLQHMNLGWGAHTDIQSMATTCFFLHWGIFPKLICSSGSLSLQFSLPGVLRSSHGGIVLDIPILVQISFSWRILPHLNKHSLLYNAGSFSWWNRTLCSFLACLLSYFLSVSPTRESNMTVCPWFLP